MDHEPGGRPVQAYLGLGGAVLIGLAFLLPWIGLFGRQLKGWQVLRLDRRMLATLEEHKQRAAEAERSPRREALQRRLAAPRGGPLAGARKKLADKRGKEAPREKLVRASETVGQKAGELRATIELVENILRWARWALIALVLLAAGQAPAALARGPTSRTGTGLASGLLAWTFSGALIVLAVYLPGLELAQGKPLMALLAGWWVATAGSLAIGLAGLASLRRDNWKYSAPLQLVPAVGFTIWFANLLF